MQSILNAIKCLILSGSLSSYVFKPQGGTYKNSDRGARPTFLCLKFGQILFFSVGRFSSSFSGQGKISAIFLGLINMPLFFWVFQFSYLKFKSQYLSFILESFYFSGLEIWIILFFWVLILVILFFWVRFQRHSIFLGF